MCFSPWLEIPACVNSHNIPCYGGGNLSDIILEMKNITKEFPGVKALDDVNLVVERGTIRA